MMVPALSQSVLSAVLLISLVGGNGAPATAPAKVDLSTPKSAAETFYDGIRRADATAIAAAISAPDPAHEKLASQYAEAIVAREQLRHAITSKFGPDAAPTDAWLPTGAQIKAAEVEEHGDRAAIKFPGGGGDLVRADGKWRLSFLAEAVLGKQVDKTLASIRDYIAGAKAATADVTGGKVKSADAAAQLFAKFPFPAVASTH
jgi:hypothetical protein